MEAFIYGALIITRCQHPRFALGASTVAALVYAEASLGQRHHFCHEAVFGSLLRGEKRWRLYLL